MGDMLFNKCCITCVLETKKKEQIKFGILR